MLPVVLTGGLATGLGASAGLAQGISTILRRVCLGLGRASISNVGNREGTLGYIPSQGGTLCSFTPQYTLLILLPTGIRSMVSWSSARRRDPAPSRVDWWACNRATTERKCGAHKVYH